MISEPFVPKGTSSMLAVLRKYCGGQADSSHLRRRRNQRQATARARARARFQRWWRSNKLKWRKRNREQMQVARLRGKAASALAA